MLVQVVNIHVVAEHEDDAHVEDDLGIKLVLKKGVQHDEENQPSMEVSVLVLCTRQGSVVDLWAENL